MTEQLMENLSNEEHERLLLMSEHAVAAPLSSAAQEVFWEFNRAASGKPDDWHYLPSIAAALRAAADQLNHSDSAHKLYAFADELDSFSIDYL